MKQPTTEQVAQWLDEAISAYMTQDGHFWHVAQQAYAAGAASRDAEIADAQDSADKRVAVAIGQRERMKDELSDAQAQAKTLATANADDSRELQERIESLEAQLADALEPGGWPYPEGHANYYMRTRVAGTLSIGHAVYDAPITQEPVNQMLLDVRRYRWLRDQTWKSNGMCVVTKPPTSVKLGSYCPSVDLLDESIDAAMKQGVKE